MEDSRQGRGVLVVAHGVGHHGVDRPHHALVDQGPAEDVDHVVEADPRDPLRAPADRAAQPHGEDGAQELERAALRRLDDAGAHVGHAQAGVLRGVRRGLPVRHDVGEEPGPACALLGELLVTPVCAVEADGRRSDEDARWLAHGRHRRRRARSSARSGSHGRPACGGP